ncbi:B-box zinc finger protein 20-like [Curcuma longa]|uniref:B-box zinc finger protein 20-like n=1 Tax=Curcuma longa TaxID=136217 RepID=UPI003D9ED08F
MKILCDVCGQESASAFCCADEAALCDACDRRVHRANKLAGKHRRFSLSAPSAQSHPLCDICREKRGFLFCQEDRAILCQDCDESIHSANHLTMKHNRFILTGVRLSPAPISSSSSTEPEPESTPAKDGAKTAVPVSDQNKTLLANASSPITTTSCNTTSSSAARPVTASTTVSAATTSSISEYLIKMCPGWCVEDLLVDDAAAVSMEDFAKGNELLPFLEPDLDGGAQEPTADKFPVWAVQVPQFSSPYFSPAASTAGLGHRQTWHANKGASVSYQWAAKTVPEQGGEDLFMVPQISPAPTPNKRTRRSLWYC